MKTSDYLDLAQKKTGARNDNQLCEILNWRSSKINNYRHNKQFMDNEAASELAELLDIPVWLVIADMEIQRAERQNDAKRMAKWSKVAKRIKEDLKKTHNIYYANSIMRLKKLRNKFCIEPNFLIWTPKNGFC